MLDVLADRTDWVGVSEQDNTEWQLYIMLEQELSSKTWDKKAGFRITHLIKKLYNLKHISNPELFKEWGTKYKDQLKDLGFDASESLALARTDAEEGNIFGMQYYLEDALNQSIFFGSDIRKELDEIRSVGLKNEGSYNDVSELISDTRIKATTCDIIFLENILGYALSFARIFEWDIRTELDEIRNSRSDEVIARRKSVSNTAKPIRRKNPMIRIAGYADL